MSIKLDFENFIWHSCAIEEVWPPEVETDMREEIKMAILGERYVYDQDIKGHMRGWKYIQRIKRPTVAQVNELHKTMFEFCDIDCVPGMMRNLDKNIVKVNKDYFAPHPDKVVELLNKWVEFEGEPIERHILFEHIHPFTDGNGRVGRLMLAAEASFRKATFKYENREKYFKLFNSESRRAVLTKAGIRKDYGKDKK